MLDHFEKFFETLERSRDTSVKEELRNLSFQAGSSSRGFNLIEQGLLRSTRRKSMQP